MARLFFACRCQHCRGQNEVDIKWIGQTVECLLCRRSFIAQDAHSQSAALGDPVHYWIHYTDHFWQHKEETTGLPEKPRTPR